MKMNKRIWVCLVAVALLLSGCSMRTAEQLYSPPKRSADYDNLQSAIDQAMEGLVYCAPLTGENQQPVQMADLDGDGEPEYLLFAKSNQYRPLHILVFCKTEDGYVHTDTVQSNGTSFDLVEIVNMDDKPGVEIVVGRQVSDRIPRAVSVYTMSDDNLEQVLSVNYSKLLTVDLDNNGVSKLMVIRPGETDTDNGIVELYMLEDGALQRSNEVSMSRPADKIKRIITGKLYGGGLAVYLASTVDDTALITDVYTVRDGMLTNVTFSNESGTSIQTMRNFYVYADDIDNDSVVELPSLLTMKPVEGATDGEKYHMIRWYAMTPDGIEVDKLHTFHNFEGGWYMHLSGELTSRMSVRRVGSDFEFYLWDEAYKTNEKMMTVYSFTAQNRDEQATADGRFVLLRTESTVYAASMTDAAVALGMTRDNVIYSFRMIQQDWKTGET